MLMSKSRLEKFLYALYSLDSSDLPTPLSRIEELYKCLVTGEEPPTFEPLSRVEKYLMAILGVYDVDSLPNPLSRVEVLLYKLATGDDNLDDVKSFLSEHEELLAEIIRNGGVGGNIDIQYVLYTLSMESNTLYNTAEKPIKSAILKGQTLVNLVGEDKKRNTIAIGKDIRDLAEFSGSKEYTLCFNVEKLNDNGVIRLQYFNISTFIMGENKNIAVGTNVIAFTTPANTTGVRIQNTGGATELIIDDLMIIESDYTNVDISYFTGMKSVQMPVLTTSNEDGTKTNILTVNEDVTLRSNGDVYDELDLITGRLTQRIDENNEVLSQEVVKTVDLSVVDQDGNDTKLSTFEDITYVTLSSEGLIPEAELEVATKNEEVLDTMSLEMDDISTSQNTLEKTSNAQSENVDATMIAATEIYEGLL